MKLKGKRKTPSCQEFASGSKREMQSLKKGNIVGITFFYCLVKFSS